MKVVHSMNIKTFKILIVDDSPIDLEALCYIVSAHGRSAYEVITATNGLEAIDKALGEKPDLILLDIMMPELDGFHTIARLKNIEETRSIPVMFLTGLNSVDDEVKGLSLGAADYITKPFREPIVRARIRTQLKIVEQMRIIEEYGFMDVLTGLPNRRNFDNHLAGEWHHAVREGRPISMLMVDVDHFKLINDTYGHLQGDVVLQAIAEPIGASLRRSTDFAARWGGEEFAVLLPNTPVEAAFEIAEAMRIGIENTFIKNINNGTPLRAKVSIGVACMTPQPDTRLVEFIRQVDVALYDAKNTGRNKSCIYQG